MLNRWSVLLSLAVVLACEAPSDVPFDAGGGDEGRDGGGDGGGLPFLDAASPDAGTDASTTAPPGPDLGEVTPSASRCSRRATLAGTTCSVVTVACPGLAPRDVELRVAEPSGTPRGTVVFGNGGNGVGFYLGAEYGPDVRNALVADGFRVIERSWPGPEGWYADNDAGLRANACRYATLLEYLHGEYTDAGAFCISGNSGGSAEVGYALTTWGVGAFVDLAVPTGGPAVTRLDNVCRPDAEWLARCDAFIDDALWSCTPSCMLPPTHEVCTLTGSDPTLEELRSLSVMHEDAVVAYPNTRVHFLYGTADCGPNVPSSMNWATAITSEVEIENVDGMPHGIMTAPEGRDAVIAAVATGCVSRH